MIINLLSSISTPVWIGIGVIGACAVASVVYGIFRNFVRMSWTSWQILVIFALTLLLKFIPPLPEAWQAFAVGAGYLVGLTALVLISGHFIRRHILKKPTRSNKFFRVMNRILGAVTSLLNIALLIVILGGFALGVMYYAVPVEALQPVYANPVWTQFGAKYIQDLVLIFLCILFMRGGYRIGLVRSLQTVLMISLTLGALVLAVYLALAVPFLKSWTAAMAGSMAKGAMNIVIATMVSYLIVVAILFLVLFALIMTGGFFFNKLIRKYRSISPTLSAVDGVILSVVFTAFFIAFTCGLNLGVVKLLELAAAQEGLPEGITQGIAGFMAFLSSSPLGGLFFYGNPFLLFFGA
ncbi:MAG: hypothetical protein K2K12_00805 [Clostridia bacterium]|nr:hypothetical protein [Clostridia bacterium]